MSTARGSVIRRGDRWSVVLDLGLDERGRRIRKWHSGYPNEKAAEKARTQLLSAVDNGRYVEANKDTVGEYIDEWLSAIRNTVRATTFSMYETNARAHIVPALGSIQLRALTPARLNSFYSELLSTGRRDGRGGLSTRTVRIIHVILHRAFRDAVRWGKLERNIAELADPPKVATREAAVWSPEQTRAFLESARDHRLAGLLQLEASTGMRRGEILGLRWSDVDLETGQLRIAQTVVVVNYKLAFSEPKTKAGRRTMALDPSTVVALKAHRSRQHAERLAWGAGWQGAKSDLVFTRENGAPIHPERLSSTFSQLVEAAKLPRITFHGLRHSYITMMLRGGVPLRVVSARAGHASANVTNAIYSHVLPGDDEAAAVTGARLLGS